MLIHHIYLEGLKVQKVKKKKFKWRACAERTPHPVEVFLFTRTRGHQDSYCKNCGTTRLDRRTLYNQVH